MIVNEGRGGVAIATIVQLPVIVNACRTKHDFVHEPIHRSTHAVYQWKGGWCFIVSVIMSKTERDCCATHLAFGFVVFVVVRLYDDQVLRFTGK